MRIIGSLLPHQKLNAKSDLLVVETSSWIEFLYRWMRGDDREICLRRIEQLFDEAILAVESAGRLQDQKLQKKYLSHISSCMPGLTNMKQTYAEDATTIAKLDFFLEQCEEIISTHNFKQDRMVVINDLPESDDSTGSDDTNDEEESKKKAWPQLGKPRLGPKIGHEQWRGSAVGRVLS